MDGLFKVRNTLPYKLYLLHFDVKNLKKKKKITDEKVKWALEINGNNQSAT